MMVEHGADVHARSKRLGLYTPRIPKGTESNPVTGTPVHQGFRETIYHPKFKGGFTALMFAAQAGDVESARTLLASGADVNEGTEETGPPLVLAASYGRQQVALLLLEKGADPNATDGYGMTALHWALEEGVVGMSGGHTQTDPYWVHPNMPELVKALLEKGYNPNTRIQHDFMPYHIHRFGRGAQQEPPQVSQTGATPFLFAAASGDVPAMRILLEGGSDPKIATFDGTTPLMVAAGMGVNLGMRGSDGVTEEIRRKALDAVQLAWELGGDVNAIGPDGRRAVHGAALYGLTEVIAFLAEKGADLDAQDMWGQTAMSIALADPDGLVYRHLPNKGQDSTFRRRARKDQETADQLLSLGATPYVRTGRDLTGF
jgi:ankyrin repeat protein